ncbi:FAD binding domain-containing protein [Stygiobacter electus]|uniref:FAD binding domain-containing protein n=1 Tax=Stygiobacter electus TaxID=3032292 RepID=A0AAE3P2X9_9BACT|nr:FAD binding domain-containing protein [Stygiobacter electus]MDF1612802.1 FAD binding domain-containing protein [Stygiobacter electus]
MTEFILNQKKIVTDILPTTVLLDFIRREQKLTGTKEGCREGDCGACTVLIGELINNKIHYKTVNSCLVPIGSVHRKHIITIEGLTENGSLTPIQNALVDEGGTQCGFCTPGFVVSMTSYFINNKNYDVQKAINTIGGNVCRCTGYHGIIRSLNRTAELLNSADGKSHLEKLISANIIPEYFKKIPKQLKEIKSAKFKIEKPKYLIGGGTDLYVQKWEDIVNSKSLIIVDKKISNEIIKKENEIIIGASVTIEDFITNKTIKKYFPQIEEQLELFGSLPIRNKATIAGNIVNASPIGDLTNILLTLNSKVHLEGKKKRIIPLENFYLGYKLLNKKKNEIVTKITFEIPPKNFQFNFEKVSKRTYLDIASVNSSIGILVKDNIIQDVRISAGGVAPIPLYLKSTSEFLTNKELTSQNVKEATQIAFSEISPISDARGSAEYKKLLLRQLIYAHFILLFPDKINAEELL